MTTDLIAYHGKKEIKAKYLTRVRAHRAADQLVRGTGWTDGRGCAVGCTLHAYDHARYPIELGVPEILARLEDKIFESIDEKRAMQWPTQFLAAIPVGADLSAVWPKFAAWMLRNICPSNSGEVVAKVFDREARGEKVPSTEWRSVQAAARGARREAWDKYYSYAAAAYADADADAAYAYADAAAAANAADAAADANAAAAADAAANAAAAADADAAAAYAANAAYARARTAARMGGRAKAWTRMADQLLELLRGAPRAKVRA
jgi:hypothetical protein